MNTNTIILRILTVLCTIGGVFAFGSVNAFPTGSLAAWLLAVAGIGFCIDFAWLLYVQRNDA